MMGTKDKPFFCFCHSGGETNVLSDGSISYVGGITSQVTVKTGIMYHDFVNAVSDRLGLDPSDTILHYTVKFDRSKLVWMRDQDDISKMLQFNDGFALVYALEKVPNSKPPSGTANNNEPSVVSDSEPDATPVDDERNDFVSPMKKARFDSAGDIKLLKKPMLHQSAGESDPSDSDDDYADFEFSDFDKDRAEDCFAADQIWACYDTTDGMPRVYVIIKKVVGPEFQLKIRSLEPRPRPDDETSTCWVQARMPIGVGRFNFGIRTTEFTSDLLTFSHKMQFYKGEQGPYIIYPRKGDTWAMFQDWNSDWCFTGKDYKEYKYEVVEIISDYIWDVGTQVGYLEKVQGFASIFQRTWLTKLDTFFVTREDVYKFSHRIPSFKMTGDEGEGVPAGSFELDRYALPRDPEENVVSPVPPGTKDNSENASTSPKPGNFKGTPATDGEYSM